MWKSEDEKLRKKVPLVNPNFSLYDTLRVFRQRICREEFATKRASLNFFVRFYKVRLFFFISLGYKMAGGEEQETIITVGKDSLTESSRCLTDEEMLAKKRLWSTKLKNIRCIVAPMVDQRYVLV